MQKGSWTWAGNAPNNGVGYWREYQSSKVAVGLAKDGSASFTFNNVPNGTYRDAVTGRSVMVTNGNLSFSVTNSSAGIYVFNGSGMIGENGVGFFESCPSGCTNPIVTTITPTSGNYTSPINVTMSATGGSGSLTIRYTTDGTTPSVSSPIYAAPFSVSTATTVKALAFDANNNVSPEEAQVYTFVLPKPVVVVTPTSGNFYDPISVTMSANTGLAPYTIYYTTDGTDPSVSSPIYTNPIAITSQSTIKALAKDANNQLSLIETRTYTFIIPPPTVTASPDEGNYPSYPINVNLTANSPRMPVNLYFTTDGTTPTPSSNLYASPINLGANGVAKTLKILAIDNLGQSSITTLNYTFEAIPDIIVYFKRPANWGTNIKIHYWNSVPTGVYTPTNWPGVAMTPVCGDWYKFKFTGITSTNLIFNDGSGNQTADLSRTTTGYYDNAWLTTTPTITGTPSVSATPAGPQTSGSAIAVTLTGTTCSGNAIIYYTTNGSTPTTASMSAIDAVNLNITQTTTLKFFTVDGSGASSAIQTHVYTITALKDISIYFKKPTSWGTTVKIHYFNVLPNTNYPNTTWSGVVMTDEGGGWYKFTFNQILSTNFVINGNATPQTADLFRNATGWYDYTVSPAVWYNSDPRVIPVELVNFQGVYNKNKREIELNWQTASEANNVGFEIERVSNGFDFKKIGFVKGFGTTATPQYYTFNDAYFGQNTVNYYRLRQLDTDNKATYSKTIAVAIKDEKTLKVYPTIVKNGILNVLNGENTEGSSFSIYNIFGQEIQRGKIGNSIDVSALPQGIFILKVGTEQAKFVKE